MQIKKAARTTIVSTQSKPAVKDNVAAIFGAKLASSLEPLNASNDKFTISGVISSAVKVGGKTNGHPQFLFLNSRPVDMPKAIRVVNEAYRFAVHLFCCQKHFSRSKHFEHTQSFCVLMPSHSCHSMHWVFTESTYDSLGVSTPPNGKRRRNTFECSI